MKRTAFLILALASIIIVAAGTLNAAQNRGRAVPRSGLPLELQRVEVRDYYSGSGLKEAGMIQNITGHVIVARENLSGAYFAAPGDKLFEKDVVFTLPLSRCRFKLFSDDVVTMAENTRIGVKGYTDNPRTKAKSSLFNMAKGKAMFYTLRLFRYKGAAMEVETPTAVSGVRGTKFGIEIVRKDGREYGQAPLLVADAGLLGGFQQLAQANPGVTTIVHGFDGTIQVTGKADGRSMTIGAGQSLNVSGTGTGSAYPTPPGVNQQFSAATQVAGGGTTSGSSSGATEGGTATGGTGATGGTSGGGAPTDTSSLTQNQNTTQTQTQSRPVSRIGYLTGLLSYDNTGMQYYMHNYRNTTRGDATTGIDAKLDSTVYKMTLVAGASPKITSLTTTWDASGMTNLPKAITLTETGYNAYQEWGTWSQPQTMNGSTSSTVYSFDSPAGHYINGDVTTNAQILALQSAGATGTYSGNAYGSLMRQSLASPVIPLTGTMSTNINYGTGAVTNFNLNVRDSGGIWGATLTGGTGSLNTSGNLGEFNITSFSSAYVHISGTPTVATYKDVNGSAYGPNAQFIGGNWRAGAGGASAAGIFQAPKTGP